MTNRSLSLGGTGWLQSPAARRASGHVVCWGYNRFGGLGDGSTRSLTPVPVVGLTDAVEIHAGTAHTCARRSSGEVACWGLNTDGQLGDGTTMRRLTPVPVVGLGDAVEVSLYALATYARRSGGQVVAWGYNQSGGLGDGTDTRSPPSGTMSSVCSSTSASARAARRPAKPRLHRLTTQLDGPSGAAPSCAICARPEQRR